MFRHFLKINYLSGFIFENNWRTGVRLGVKKCENLQFSRNIIMFIVMFFHFLLFEFLFIFEYFCCTGEKLGVRK